jgi:hypothetical protein
MMRRTILLVATMALSLFAANCVLLAQDLTHPQRAEAMAANTGFSQDCQQSAVGNFDPIVFPNTPPGVDVGHRHAFFGSTAIRSDATLADLQAGTSNCTFRSTYPTTNKSAYWVPDLLLRSGTWAGIGRVEIYYRAGNLSDAAIAKMRAFPPGLKMIVDNVPNSNVNWECAKAGDANNPQYHYPRDCADGYDNTLHIFFPQCGVNGALDSDNHRSHMAFPVNGKCPADHPIVYPRINYAVHYQAQYGAGAQLSSGDAYTSAHADAWEAWETQNLQALIDKCIKSGVTCGKTP